MADNSFITQCPHCNTSFRVRNEQLAVANGSVRCGACLQVFSARNHIVSSPAPKSTVAKQKPIQKEPQPKPSKPVEPTFSKVPPPPQDEFNFSSDDDDETEFLFMDNEEEDFVFSDGPDDSLFDEEERDDGFGELSDSFLNLSNTASNQSREPNHFQKETIELESDSLDDDEMPDESWAESMLEEIEKEDKISLSKPAVFEPFEASSQSKPPPEPTRKTPVKSMVDFDEPPITATSPSASQVVSNASKEIELDFAESDHLQKLRPLGWGVVAMLFLLLAAQFAWYQRDTYARMDQWRGLYQKACNILSCSLPEQIDLEAIRTSVLVREHKDSSLNDIRIVDIVLTNKAPFKQPFPNLLLQYTDVNNNLVADQTFTPGEYLKGELTGEKLMPINTRIYVSFPIKKPADNALNYQLILGKQ